MNPFRKVHHLFEQSIEPVPDQNTLFHRLDVDVARLALDRAPHDEVDQVDDRGRLAAFTGSRGLEDLVFSRPAHDRRIGRQIAHTGARVGGHVRRKVGAGRRDARQRLVGVADLNRFENVAARRDDLLDSIPGLELEVLDQAEQQRVGHCDGQQIFFETDCDADALEGDLFGNQNDGRQVW
jgi:hypothetical protein